MQDQLQGHARLAHNCSFPTRIVVPTRAGSEGGVQWWEPPPTPGGFLATFTDVNSCHSSRRGTNGIKWGETKEPSGPHVSSAGGLCCLSRSTSASFPYGQPQQLPAHPAAMGREAARGGWGLGDCTSDRHLPCSQTWHGLCEAIRTYKLPHS